MASTTALPDGVSHFGRRGGAGSLYGIAARTLHTRNHTMNKAERRTVVEAVQNELLRWIAFETAGKGGALPPIRKVAKRMTVGVGAVREAINRLESLGLVVPVSGARLDVVPGSTAISADTLPLFFKAAAQADEKLKVARAWIGLKWLVASQSLPQLVGRPALEVAPVVSALDDLVLKASNDETFEVIAEQEAYVLWCAAWLSRRSELVPLANSLVRGRAGFRELWPLLVDTEEVRAYALGVGERLRQNHGRQLRGFLSECRSKEEARIKELIGPAQNLAHRTEELRSVPDEPSERSWAGDEITEPRGRPVRD